MAQEHLAALRRWLPVLLVSAGLLCVVAIVNGGPIIYPDTLAYLIDAKRFFHLQAPYAVRPPFYGFAVWLLHWDSQFGLALYAQALVGAHLIYLVARTAGAGLRPAFFLLLIVGLTLLTPLPWHIAHLLPDVFVAYLILALYMLAFCRDGLGRGETIYLVLLATAATSFHITAIPVAFVAFAFALVARPWDRRARPWLALLPIVLALSGSLAFNYAVWRRVTLTPNSPPHLLARLLADGPARDYLHDRCPGADLELCAYLDRLPPTEDGFLWEMLPSIPGPDGKRIKAESGAVILGTLKAYPAQVIGHMLANVARQLVTIRSETQFRPDEWAALERDDQVSLASSAARSLQARGAFERPALDGVNTLDAAVAVLSLLAALVLLARALRLGERRPALLLLSVLLGLLANAFACGGFGGVFGRYEGRVIWLLPFAVVTAALALSRSRTGDPSRISELGRAANIAR